MPTETNDAARPNDVIAPREDLPYQTSDFFGEMFVGANPDGTVLEYHGLQLLSRTNYDNGVRVYEIYTEDDALIEVVNLSAFRTMTEFKRFLDEIVAYNPANREEWVNRR